MAEVDWDGLLEQASDSPRALLAELLASDKDFDQIVIVYTQLDGTLGCYQSTKSGYNTIAMLEYQKWYECQQISRAVE